MYQPSGRQLPHFAFLWSAMVAASASEIAASAAEQFVELAIGPATGPAACEATWATPNTVALNLKTVRLRSFATRTVGVATLLCAPFALHGAAISDLAPGHSLVAALRDAGLPRVFLTDWLSARTDMRFLGIDDYLADLNVLVDHLGGSVDLVGLCQGGWLALLYAARFPAKVGKLVLAGAPVDIAAGPSAISALADSIPLGAFRELVKIGDGRVQGQKVLKFWGPESVSPDDIHQLLETPEPIGSPAFARLEAQFRAWYSWTLDLPGIYYIEIVDKLYKHNELATGRLVALGQRIDVAAVRTPMFLLAARDDELVAPAQLLATERLVGTPADKLRKEMAPCGHLGLFMGRTALSKFWPQIVRWLTASRTRGRRSSA
jgi:poly(3-hydroxyalkanoate) synthetase